MFLPGEFSTLPVPRAMTKPCKFSLFTLLDDKFIFIYPYPEAEVPALYKGLLTCDFPVEDILEDISEGRGEIIHGRNLQQYMTQNKNATTGNYYFCHTIGIYLSLNRSTC